MPILPRPQPMPLPAVPGVAPRALALSVLLGLAAAGPALAACPAETLMSCRMGAKALELCLQGTAVSYAFGPPGQPELWLAKPLARLAYVPWNGIGRSIWESVTLPNDGYAYEVWQSLDRMAENPVAEGGVNVLQGDSLVATLTCDPGTMTGALDVLYDRITAQGLCWDTGTFTWSQNCN